MSSTSAETTSFQQWFSKSSAIGRSRFAGRNVPHSVCKRSRECTAIQFELSCGGVGALRQLRGETHAGARWIAAIGAGPQYPGQTVGKKVRPAFRPAPLTQATLRSDRQLLRVAEVLGVRAAVAPAGIDLTILWIRLA